MLSYSTSASVPVPILSPQRTLQRTTTYHRDYIRRKKEKSADISPLQLSLSLNTLSPKSKWALTNQPRRSSHTHTHTPSHTHNNSLCLLPSPPHSHVHSSPYLLLVFLCLSVCLPVFVCLSICPLFVFYPSFFCVVLSLLFSHRSSFCSRSLFFIRSNSTKERQRTRQRKAYHHHSSQDCHTLTLFFFFSLCLFSVHHFFFSLFAITIHSSCSSK